METSLTDIKKQYEKLKAIIGDEDSFDLSGEDALRCQDALHLLVERRYLYDVNADGEIDEAEMDKRDIESSYYYPEIIFLSDGRVAMQMEITLNYTEEDDVNTYYGWPAKGSLAINIFYTRK